MGVSAITISVKSTREFDFGGIFFVSFKELRVGCGKSKYQFTITGGLRVTNLAGVTAAASFTELTINPGRNVPEVSLKGITLNLCVSNSFEIRTTLEQIRSEQELGFEGDVWIDTEMLDPISGSVKLTRVRSSDGWVPSIVIYFETPLEASLFAGFFLRKIGIGFGINQTLRGLDKMTGEEDMLNHLIRFVSDPRGLRIQEKLSPGSLCRPNAKGTLPHGYWWVPD